MAEPVESLTFVNSVYTEALALAQQAQDYLAGQARHERADMTLVERALVTAEAMRLTARLSEMIAWLLTQRAVQAGELTREEAAQPAHRLSRKAPFAYADDAAEAQLPPRLRELMDESHRLYRRVARLDDMLGKAEG